MRPDPRTADELLEALSREKGLRGRVRLLGRSIELLRRLPPADRERVAMRVGSRLLWERLERSFLADGELSAAEQAAREALERMGSADPGQLRELAKRVRERDAAGLRDLALGTIVEALEEEAEVRALEPAGAPAADELAPFPIGVVPFATPAPAPATAPAPAAEAAPASVARAEPPAAVRKPEKPAPPAQPVFAQKPPPPRPVREPSAPRPEPPRAITPPPAPVARAEPSREAAPDATLLDTRDRLRTLRALQGDPDAVRAIGREGRRALVARLGGGWASRRALSRMIQARALEDLDEALALLAAVDSPVARIWCLGDLLDGWPLAAGEIERVLAAAPSEAARRRLERRIPRPDARLLAPR